MASKWGLEISDVVTKFPHNFPQLCLYMKNEGPLLAECRHVVVDTKGEFNDVCFWLGKAGGSVVKKSTAQFDAMVLAQTVFPHEALLHRTGGWTAMLHAIPSVMDMV